MILFSSEIFVVLLLWVRHLLVTLLTAIVFKIFVSCIHIQLSVAIVRSHSLVKVLLIVSTDIMFIIYFLQVCRINNENICLMHTPLSIAIVRPHSLVKVLWCQLTLQSSFISYRCAESSMKISVPCIDCCQSPLWDLLPWGKFFGGQLTLHSSFISYRCAKSSMKIFVPCIDCCQSPLWDLLPWGKFFGVNWHYIHHSFLTGVQNQVWKYLSHA